MKSISMSLDRFLIKSKRKISLESDDEELVNKKPKVEQNDKSKDANNLGDASDLTKIQRMPANLDSMSTPVKKDEHMSLTKEIVIQSDLKWRKLKAENLDCDYVQLFSAKVAHELLGRCEKELVYNSGEMAKVQIFGKWHNIARKQVAHGDAGLSYTFSGKTVTARPWVPLLTEIRDTISQLTGHNFNFVLVNRYKDGHDHIGEHKDDEKDLVYGHPIASLSLGQPRDFIFKHQDARGKNASRNVAPVKIELQNGGLLMMNHPTNSFWYHSLPQRKKLHNVRINMTFRKMVVGRKK